MTSDGTLGHNQQNTYEETNFRQTRTSLSLRGTNLNLHDFNYSARLRTKQAGRLQSKSKILPIISEPECIAVDIESCLHS